MGNSTVTMMSRRSMPAPDLARSPATGVSRLVVTWVAIAVTTANLGTATIAYGVPPGGKSRYRSAVSHSQVNPPQSSSANNNGPYASSGHPQSAVHTQSTEQRKSGGLLGLHKLLPSNRKEQSTAYQTLLQTVPMQRLTNEAKERLASVAERPTLYRRLPTQAIRCDEELFLFLTRHPEAIIGMWDLMEITKVQANRIGTYKLDASDGSGTTCQIDLLYGDRNLHVFVADGMYDGKFTQKPIRGSGVFVFQSSYAIAADGSTTVTGTLDCYIKLGHLGADLLARSLGGLIGKSADHNFVETARFISQVSQACENNPYGMLDVIDQMPQVDDPTRERFAKITSNVARRYVTRTARQTPQPVFD